ncbi:MAG: hypothetical protein KAX26_06545, partial [Anaerolineae bacterium]|nr:hypothetical protein [Anaerolineae bacterium]
TITPRPTRAPASTPTPDPPIPGNQGAGGPWHARYYTNTDADLAGIPALRRQDAALDFTWGWGSPDPSLPADNFSAVWRREVEFSGGRYTFTTYSDDGVRLYVAGRPVIDSWQPMHGTRIATLDLSEGTHEVRLHYFERTGAALVRLNWQRHSAQAAWSEGLETYNGEGFSLQYPVSAQVESVDDRVHIIGPQVSVKPGDADWFYSGPAYELIVRTYDNPKELDAESWARNYILASWQEAKEQGGPLMGSPVSESGEIIEKRVGRSVVAGYPAFWASFFGGDSCHRTFYLTNKHQVVVLSFDDYPLANQPLAMVQQDVYALIMGTFRFGKR